MKITYAIDSSDQEILTRVNLAVSREVALKKELNRPYTYYDAADNKIYQVQGNEKKLIKDMSHNKHVPIKIKTENE